MSKMSSRVVVSPLEAKRKKVERWLVEEGWSMVPAELAVPLKMAWVIAAEMQKTTIYAFQQPNRPDQLFIQGSVGLNNSQRAVFFGLSSEQRKAIIWDLRLDLLKLGVDFSGVSEVLEVVHVRQAVFNDGLTKDRFMQRVGAVSRAQLFVAWTFARHCAEAPAPEPEEGFFIN